jgi:trans-2,3-dihydro-3-hydroxyanthranilate isomerase
MLKWDRSGVFVQPEGMMRRAYAVYDVFSTTRLAGNPLAVVFEAEGLDGYAMQRIAGEFNLSETVFVLPPADAGHRAGLRIFTPVHELPFAGHPTVGSAVAIAESSGEALPASFMLEEKVGPVPCTVRKDGEGLFAEFGLPRLPERVPFEADASGVAAALGLQPGRIGFDGHVVTKYSAGVPFMLVPVADLEAAGMAKLDAAAWRKAAGLSGEAPGAFLYCREAVGRSIAFHARMFAPHLGIEEDPATGSAVAALAGAIVDFERLPDGAHRLLIEQGLEMGRPSTISLTLEVEQGRLAAARIGGHAVRIMEGTLLT